MQRARERLKAEGTPVTSIFPCSGKNATRLATWEGVTWNLRGLSLFTDVSVQDLMYHSKSYGVTVQE